MTPEQFDAGVNVVRALAEFGSALGLGTVIVAWLKKHKIDVQALQNNKLVAAAERAAVTYVTDVVEQGKPLTDPAVLADAEKALQTSLVASHFDTAQAAGASMSDIVRIARNAISHARTVVPGAAPAAAIVQPLEAQLSHPADDVAAAVDTIHRTQDALSKLVSPDSPAASTFTTSQPMFLPPGGTMLRVSPVVGGGPGADVAERPAPAPDSAPKPPVPPPPPPPAPAPAVPTA